MKYFPGYFHLMYVKGNTAINFVYCRTQKGAKNLMENLVKKAKSGDSGAFAQLIRMNTQSMYKAFHFKKGFLLQNLDDSDPDQ